MSNQKFAWLGYVPLRWAKEGAGVARDTRPGTRLHNELENHHLVREFSHEKL